MSYLIISNLNDSAHVVKAADDGRMHALTFDKVTHRVVSGDCQAVLLAVEAVDQVEEDFGFEIRHLQLVDVVPEQVVMPGADSPALRQGGCR